MNIFFLFFSFLPAAVSLFLQAAAGAVWQIFIREAQNIDPSGMYELNVLRKKSENYGKQDNKTAAYKIQNSRDVQNSKVETAYLYKISKSFLKSVKECLKNSR